MVRGDYRQILAVLVVLACAVTAGAQSRPLKDVIFVVHQTIQGHDVLFPYPFGPQLPAAPDFQGETGPGRFLAQWVPPEESVTDWTQIIALASTTALPRADEDPAAFVVGLLRPFAIEFAERCAQNPSIVADVDQRGVHGYRAMIGFRFGCGRLHGQPRSEDAMIQYFITDHATYSLQWAERGPTHDPGVVDTARWRQRGGLMFSLQVCPRLGVDGTPHSPCD